MSLKASSKLSSTNKGTASRSKEVIIPRLLILARPYPGYCVQFCAVAEREAIYEIELVQWRAAKIVRGLKHTCNVKRS